MKRASALTLLALAGCQVTPTDPFQHALGVVEEGRFLEALDLLDGVPPSNPGYTEARTMAQALERRIRTSHEKVLEGLTLRSEWRDKEAIGKFEQALAIWGDVAGARGLIRATRRRMVVLEGKGGPPAAVPPGGIPAVTTTPVLRPEPGAVVAAKPQADRPGSAEPIADTKASPPAGPAGEVGRGAPSGPNPSAPPAAAPSDPVTSPSARPAARRRVEMSEVTRLLGEGRMDEAMDMLEELWRAHPADPKLAAVFSRVLHQRALLAYGQGRLQAAIDDWGRVLRLEGGHAQAAQFMKAAQTELIARRVATGTAR